MKLEQLQSLSDTILNEWGATKVMGWKVEASDNVDYIIYRCTNGNYLKEHAWNPCSDMNDALELAEITFEEKHLRLRLERGESDKYFAAFVTTPQSHSYILAYDHSAAKAVTMAAIMEKLWKENNSLAE